MVSEEMYRLGSTRSSIRELFEYGNRKAAEIGSENVMDFSLGNPSIPAPKAVEEAIEKLLREQTPVSLHGYTSAPGNIDVRRAISADLNNRFRANIGPENLFMIGGAAPALISCLRALTNGRDSEVIGIAPYFPEYRVFAESSANAKFQVVSADTEAFQINFSELEEKINSKTSVVIINSPNNPSGVVYTKETLERLGGLLDKKSRELGTTIYLLTDEPYRELVYNGAEAPYVPAFYKNTVMCYSYSKSLSLAGERIGYVMIPCEVENWQQVYSAVAGAARAIGHVCAPSLMQLVVGMCSEVRPDTGIYQRNSALLYEGMTEMGYKCAKPDGAFYLFFEAPCGLSGQEFSDLAKENYCLLLVPGDSFGCPGHLRMSYCVPTERVEQALPFMKKLMEDAKNAAARAAGLSEVSV